MYQQCCFFRHFSCVLYKIDRFFYIVAGFLEKDRKGGIQPIETSASNLLGYSTESGWGTAVSILWATPPAYVEGNVWRVLACPLKSLKVRINGNWDSRGEWLTQVYIEYGHLFVSSFMLYKIVISYRYVLYFGQMCACCSTSRYMLLYFSLLQHDACRPSVRLSVCNIGGLWSHRLEILEINCTDN